MFFGPSLPLSADTADSDQLTGGKKKKKSPGTFQSATVNPKTLEMEGIFNLLKSPEVLFLMLSNCFSIQTPSEIGNLCLIIPSDGELC